jgi:hypothetical protein
MIGCGRNPKNKLTVHYLYLAEKHGAVIRELHEVHEIKPLPHVGRPPRVAAASCAPRQEAGMKKKLLVIAVALGVIGAPGLRSADEPHPRGRGRVVRHGNAEGCQ